MTDMCTIEETRTILEGLSKKRAGLVEMQRRQHRSIASIRAECAARSIEIEKIDRSIAKARQGIDREAAE